MAGGTDLPPSGLVVAIGAGRHPRESVVENPTLRIVEIHTSGGIRQIKEAASLTEEKLFGRHKFSLSLEILFSNDPYV